MSGVGSAPADTGMGTARTRVGHAVPMPGEGPHRDASPRPEPAQPVLLQGDTMTATATATATTVRNGVDTAALFGTLDEESLKLQ